MSHEPQIMTIFVSTLYDTTEQVMAILRFDLFLPVDVIDDAMSVWHISFSLSILAKKLCLSGSLSGNPWI